MNEPLRRGRPRSTQSRLTSAPKPLKDMTPAELRQYRTDMRAKSRQRQAAGIPTPTKGRRYLSAAQAAALTDPQPEDHKRLTTWLPVDLVNQVQAAVEAAGGELDLTQFMTEAVRAYLRLRSLTNRTPKV